MQDNYNAVVLSPLQQKLKQEHEKQQRDFNEVKLRFDKEKEYIDF